MAKVNIVFDATMLDMFQLCPQRFYNRFVLNKESASKPRQLDRGTVMHTGLERYYSELKGGKHFDDAASAGLTKLWATLAESNLDDDDSRLVTRTFEENIDYWRVEDQRVQINDVEKSFAYVLYEDDEVRMVMIGKIDLSTTDNQYVNLPNDHKTMDRDNPVRRLSNQFMNYCYALESNFLKVNKIGFQKTLAVHERFKRVMVSYDPLILNEWKDNTIKWLFMYLECVATNTWPMNFTSCDKYHRPCEYLDPCESSGLEAKLFKLTSNFRDAEVWDVSKILVKKE